MYVGGVVEVEVDVRFYFYDEFVYLSIENVTKVLAEWL